MPANLTQQYLKAEQRYRDATSPDEELVCLQEMLKEIPKHKGTDKLQADLKHKISRLKDEMANARSSPTKSSRIPKQGAGRGVILGGPNAGKSKLLSVLTRATPEIADYPFTTREPQPGMMPWENVYVQLIDTPPITRDVFDPMTLELVRGADVVLLMLDLGSDEGWQELLDVLHYFRNGKTRLGNQTEIDPNDIGVTYTKTILVPNKIEVSEAADRWEFFTSEGQLSFPTYPISCESLTGIEDLRNAIFQSTHSLRIYTKAPSKKEPDLDKPFTLKVGGTVQDLAELVHRDIANNLKGAKVWGKGLLDGSLVKADYELNDGDIVELHS